MNLAIIVKYSCNSRGQAYLYARAAKVGRCTLRWSHGISVEKNFESAALRLAEKLGWLPGNLVGGWLAGDKEAVFVFVTARSAIGELVALAKTANGEGGALHKSVTTSELARIGRLLV